MTDLTATDCWVEYRAPGEAEGFRRDIDAESDLMFGRDPGERALVLDPDDPTISAVAGRIRFADGIWLLSNTSSYATLRLEGSSVFRYVHPGDEAEIRFGETIVVPSERFEHKIATNLPPVPSPAPTDRRGGTRPLIGRTLELRGERRQAVAALVAGWFVPDLFDPVPLPSAEIARLVSTRQRPVTEKAVNHKLQRVRDVLSESLGVPIETRQMLADVVIQHRLVGLADVRALPGLRR